MNVKVHCNRNKLMSILRGAELVPAPISNRNAWIID